MVLLVELNVWLKVSGRVLLRYSSIHWDFTPLVVAGIETSMSICGPAACLLGRGCLLADDRRCYMGHASCHATEGSPWQADAFPEFAHIISKNIKGKINEHFSPLTTHCGIGRGTEWDYFLPVEEMNEWSVSLSLHLLF
jgi:hypothetical protein